MSHTRNIFIFGFIHYPSRTAFAPEKIITKQELYIKSYKTRVSNSKPTFERKILKSHRAFNHYQKNP